MAYFRCTSGEVRQHFSWKTWVRKGGLNATTYNSLDDVLEDEVALRRLFLVHASIDYMAFFEESNEDVQKIINCDLAAKWINLSDYALDTLSANIIIKHYMDIADKYFYGEWALMPQVPKMTSNTAPYGEVFVSSEYDSTYLAWKAFDGVTNDSLDCWVSAQNQYTNSYIGYKFFRPILLSSVAFITRAGNLVNAPRNVVIQGSNDNTTWVNIKEYTNIINEPSTKITIDCSDNTETYSYVRMLIKTKLGTSNYVAIANLQFYAWQPKGNVPVMTANDAPYGTVISTTATAFSYPAYRAFDGNSVTYWQLDSASSPFIGYKFVNPVIIKRFAIRFWPTQYEILTGKIQGSNDNSTWKDISTTITFEQGTAAKQIFDINNNEPFLYYRLQALSLVKSTVIVNELQFYGRELKVSVPVMTSNTTPYGEVYVSGSFNSGWSNGYQVFTDNTSGWIPPAESVNDYLYYKFTTPIKLASVLTKFTLVNKSSVSFNIEASNNGNAWDVILSNISVNNSSYNVFDVDDDNIYTYVRIKPTASWATSTGSSYGGLLYLQFYGLDYSEKEFEAGVTKKWMYDHGVELETMTAKVVGTATPIKETDNLHIKVGAVVSSGCGFASPQIDLTPYDLVRGKVGDIVASSAQAANLSTSTTDNVDGSGIVSSVGIRQGDSYLPNNIALDISADDQNMYVFFRTSLNTSSSVGAFARECTLKELWLE